MSNLICVWPNGFSCDHNERNEMSHLSDDYFTVNIDWGSEHILTTLRCHLGEQTANEVFDELNDVFFLTADQYGYDMAELRRENEDLHQQVQTYKDQLNTLVRIIDEEGMKSIRAKQGIISRFMRRYA